MVNTSAQLKVGFEVRSKPSSGKVRGPNKCPELPAGHSKVHFRMEGRPGAQCRQAVDTRLNLGTTSQRIEGIKVGLLKINTCQEANVSAIRGQALEPGGTLKPAVTRECDGDPRASGPREDLVEGITDHTLRVFD